MQRLRSPPPSLSSVDAIGCLGSGEDEEITSSFEGDGASTLAESNV
ncbi:hypothetical protein PC116_g23224 [Phytophthora cactorum]|uniref:Uncharacterized protein n=1 Tax=Phytophthora cactorum TaxID=29920 RepID=A0A8T1JTH1_9STRA|nr:hypothetical protein Pcac1_g839 [Phytophthora cactorum]KAG2896434.1 hypothetical protein PC114_g15079 [Phytophthora cactorum]KAG2905708.1 hypothetical protein PC117_g20682 [Phytophthora cactorum]KAG2984434.1 hypothetical protein PC119_g20402 [Phytophthora cactorum]KAG3012162.1 hypothetical protein PC120_g14038 [Phytophthora cactorum]